MNEFGSKVSDQVLVAGALTLAVLGLLIIAFMVTRSAKWRTVMEQEDARFLAAIPHKSREYAPGDAPSSSRAAE